MQQVVGRLPEQRDAAEPTRRGGVGVDDTTVMIPHDHRLAQPLQQAGELATLAGEQTVPVGRTPR